VRTIPEYTELSASILNERSASILNDRQAATRIYQYTDQPYLVATLLESRFVNMGDERTDTCPSAAASREAVVSAAPADSSRSSIIFNTKQYDNWEEALIAVGSLVKKSRNDQATLWHRTNVVHEVDGSFSLQCASCTREFALKNPSNFWKTHKKACVVGERGSELTRGGCCVVEARIAHQSKFARRFTVIIALQNR
jgi:hypothetical protein